MSRTPVRLAAAFLLFGGGCLGTVDGNEPAGPRTDDPSQPPAAMPGEPGSNPGTPPPTLPTQPGQNGPCSEAAPSITAARRLTREQFGATVRDLLGDKSAGSADVSNRLPADDVSDGLFVAPGTLIATPTWAGNVMSVAEELAKGAVANLATLVPCQASEGEECARKFISSFGKRAYRRPLEAGEVEGLLGVYKTGAAGGFSHGIELTLQAILQSPSFLYRLELGQKAGSVGGAIKLTPYEVAARLSYGLWGTMPDEDLMKAADAGQLAKPEEIEAQARRMVNDERARRNIVEFTGRWFGLEQLDEVMKDPDVYGEFNEKLIDSMKGGARALVDNLLKAAPGEAKFETLLQASYGYVDAATAPLFGVTATGAGFSRVDLPAGKRFGLLTDVGILTAHTFADPSAPIHRGKFVRERLLCQDPPNPPADLNVEPPTPRPGIGTRERLKEHVDVPACRGCHEFMDPLGFAFGNYDGLGRWRDKDQGQPIDASGYVMFSDVDGSYKDLGELTGKLASSTQVKDCVAGTFLRFAAGTESAIDDCARTKLRAAFSAGKGDLRELIIAITRTDAFQYRRSIPGEVLP